MTNPIKRGSVSGQVSDFANPNAGFTPHNQTSLLNPFGLTLRQTITSSGSVTIPAGINWVYAVMTSGGGSSYFGQAGSGGHLTMGWTLAQNTCIIGAGGVSANNGGYTRYGHLIASGVNTRGGNAGVADYYARPGGASNGGVGINCGTGVNDTSPGGNGANGVCAGGGGRGASNGGNANGGNGGNGIVGGGGGRGGYSGTAPTSTVGGNGGNGIGIDGTIYTGGTGSSVGSGGGGAGIAGNGGNASGSTAGTGGLGGGGAGSGSGGDGAGGAGILYLFY